LDEALIGGPAIAHDQRETRHAFGADQSDFDAAVAHAVGDDGYDTAVDEVGMLDQLVASLDLETRRQIHELEVRFEQAEIDRREMRQDRIGF
jgi:hypothetical protein